MHFGMQRHATEKKIKQVLQIYANAELSIFSHFGTNKGDQGVFFPSNNVMLLEF